MALSLSPGGDQDQEEAQGEAVTHTDIRSNLTRPPGFRFERLNKSSRHYYCGMVFYIYLVRG